jgi:hypothetical protein
MKAQPFLAFIMLAASAAAVAQAQKVVVPAFFPLGTHSDPSKPADWVRIQNAGSAVQIVVALGDAGGFQTLVDPGLTDARNQFNANHSAGQLVFGYVNSQFATNVNASNEAQTWSAKYPTQLQGVFFDNGPTFDPSQSTKPETDFQTYYEGLYSQVHSINALWQVMLNASQFPGTAQTQPQDWLMSHPATDYAVIWENAWSVYQDVTLFKAIGPGGNLQDPPAWWTSAAYQGRLSHVVFSANQNQVASAVSLSRTRGSPSMYIFDGDSGAYSRVACYFEQEIAALQNQPPVSGTTWCNTACTDINSDTGNCGACNNVCAGTPNGHPTCPSGRCDLACDSGFTLCSGTSCVNTSSDNNNCGACGNVCPASTTCSGGQCVCGAGFTNCGGTCVNLSNNVNNCGSCGHGCFNGANPSCVGGACSPCAAGYNACCKGQVCSSGICPPTCVIP